MVEGFLAFMCGFPGLAVAALLLGVAWKAGVVPDWIPGIVITICGIILLIIIIWLWQGLTHPGTINCCQ